MAETDPDCLFCKIVAGQIPSTIVHRSDEVVAFRDIDPQAPTHVLIVPVAHFPNAAASAAADPTILATMVAAAAQIAHDEGLVDDAGEVAYRLVFNTGTAAQQSVFHTHLHLLGGRSFQWPPG